MSCRITPCQRAAGIAVRAAFKQACQMGYQETSRLPYTSPGGEHEAFLRSAEPYAALPPIEIQILISGRTGNPAPNKWIAYPATWSARDPGFRHRTQGRSCDVGNGTWSPEIRSFSRTLYLPRPPGIRGQPQQAEGPDQEGRGLGDGPRRCWRRQVLAGTVELHQDGKPRVGYSAMKA